jgi:hypothetical protein
MRRNLIYLAFLLCATNIRAQTPVAVQNANFSAPVTFTQSSAAGDQWEPNNVPGWMIGPGPGVPGTLAGIQQLVSACGPNAPQMLYSNDPTVSQDVGPQQAGMYVLTVGICNRSDTSGATYTLSLSGCTESALNSTIPAGTIQNVTLSCPISNPSGGNIIGLGCSGGQCDFASVSLTFLPAAPPVTNQVAVSTNISYEDGTIPTIYQILINDITPSPSVTELTLTPNPTTGAASGSVSVLSTDTYQSVLYVAGAAVSQSFWNGALLQTLVPNISQVNLTIVLCKTSCAAGAIKSFSQSAQ